MCFVPPCTLHSALCASALAAFPALRTLCSVLYHKQNETNPNKPKENKTKENKGNARLLWQG